MHLYQFTCLYLLFSIQALPFSNIITRDIPFFASVLTTSKPPVFIVSINDI